MNNNNFISSVETINPYFVWAIYILSVLFLYFTLRKEKLTYISWLFIFVSFRGVFEYLGPLPYRLSDFLIFVFIVFNIVNRRINKPHKSAIYLFLLYTLSYFFSIAYHKFSDPLSDFKQYIIFALPYAIFILFDKARYSINYKQEMRIIIKVLNVQVFASILKLILIGFNEKLVGTLTTSGGSVAAVFPVIYFMVYWFKNKGNLAKTDWFWVLSSLLVAIASNKRAIWFLLPITIVLFFLVNRKLRFNFSTVALVMLVPFILYFGTRFNPSLNPEGKVWGSFDPDYITDYIISYNLGNKDKEINYNIATGRIGSNIYYLNKLINDFSDDVNIFGFGNAEYNQFEGNDIDSLYQFGFSSKYMLTGWVSMLVKFGSIVLFPFLFSLIYMIRTIKNNRDFILMLFIFVSWFIFYSGVLITNPLLLSCFLFTIFFIQYHINSNKLIVANKSASY